MWEKSGNYYFNGEWRQNNILLEKGDKLYFNEEWQQNNILLENGDIIILFKMAAKGLLVEHGPHQ